MRRPAPSALRAGLALALLAAAASRRPLRPRQAPLRPRPCRSRPAGNLRWTPATPASSRAARRGRRRLAAHDRPGRVRSAADRRGVPRHGRLVPRLVHRPRRSARAIGWAVRFGSVRRVAEAWLNGEPIGRHTDPYVPFELPAAGLRPGRTNTLVVRVDNRKGPEPREGWWNWGGIITAGGARAARPRGAGEPGLLMYRGGGRRAVRRLADQPHRRAARARRSP